MSNNPCICCGNIEFCDCYFEDENATIIKVCPCGCLKCESCCMLLELNDNEEENIEHEPPLFMESDDEGPRDEGTSGSEIRDEGSD
jgi:hypothetical protein